MTSADRDPRPDRPATAGAGSPSTGDVASPGKEPAPVAPRRRSRRVVRQGTEQAGVAGLGSDDDAAAWGDVRPGAATASHDAELLRDVPPHWS